jgi:transketolase
VNLEFIKSEAYNIRKNTILSLTAAGSGHIGGSLGLADVFAVLYFAVMKHDPENPKLVDRDKLILSIGHVAPVHYATLVEAGYFPESELLTLRKMGSRLQGHPSFSVGLPGIETASGSLGQGLSIAVGMALADKLDMIDRNIFCICGDGELQEGQIWEAAMSASHHKLNRITLVVDRNFVQIDGKTDEVMDVDPLLQKFEAFGWNVLECDGNNVNELISSFAARVCDKPNVIIAKTVMGKGVPEIEGDYGWHGKAPDDTQCERFLKQLY